MFHIEKHPHRSTHHQGNPRWEVRLWQSCILIIYYEYSKAYRFYNPKSHQIIISRDAIFDEGGVWDQQKLCVDDESLEDSITNVQPCVQPSQVQTVKSATQPCSIMPPSSPTSSSNNPISISPSSPSSTNNSPSVLFDVNRNKKAKRAFKDNPPSQIMNNNFNKRLTRSQRLTSSQAN